MGITKEQLLEKLDEDLAWEYAGLVQYVHLQREVKPKTFRGACKLWVNRADGTNTADRATLANLLSKISLRFR